MGKILAGCSLRDATERAMTTVKNMIVKNAGNADKYKGIPIETCLEEID
jgi:pyridoxine kinase